MQCLEKAGAEQQRSSSLVCFGTGGRRQTVKFVLICFEYLEYVVEMLICGRDVLENMKLPFGIVGTTAPPKTHPTVEVNL